jgi:hypothetical protein
MVVVPSPCLREQPEQEGHRYKNGEDYQPQQDALQEFFNHDRCAPL